MVQPICLRAVSSVAVLVTTVLSAPVWAGESDLAAMVTPEYNEDGHLIRPTGYRMWVFVGASLGLSYFGEEKTVDERVFHHIYMQPEAYRHYVETGEFAEKTMLVMENYSAGSKEDNTATELLKDKEQFKILHGHFEDARVGLEVALKDSEHFEEGWAYFNFSSRQGLKPTGAAFPKAVCWDCHNSHGADDNVFVQFYPILREPLEKRLKEKATD